MLEFCTISDIGGRRNNEDFYGNFTIITSSGRFHVFAVADGVGGVEGGEVASETAVTELGVALADATEVLKGRINIGLLLKKAFHNANEAVRKKGFGGHGIYTTLLAAILDEEGRGMIANVGDSRAYVIGREIMWRTKDHSRVQELIDMRQLRPEEADNHPLKHIVTRALGMEGAEPDLYSVDISDGSLLLLFTDGLSNTLSDDEILSRSNGRAHSVGQSLIKAAKPFSSDNLTIIAIKKVQI